MHSASRIPLGHLGSSLEMTCMLAPTRHASLDVGTVDCCGGHNLLDLDMAFGSVDVGFDKFFRAQFHRCIITDSFIEIMFINIHRFLDLDVLFVQTILKLDAMFPTGFWTWTDYHAQNFGYIRYCSRVSGLGYFYAAFVSEYLLRTGFETGVYQ